MLNQMGAVITIILKDGLLPKRDPFRPSPSRISLSQSLGKQIRLSSVT